MDPVVHFEMPCDDRDRMARFWEAAFGWKMQMFGAEMGPLRRHRDEEGVTAAGGAVLGAPVEIPGVGQYVAFNDTEGNRASMLQPLPRG